MQKIVIPVSEPVVDQAIKRAVTQCIGSGWISSAGGYVTEFEKNFAQFIGVKYALTTNNGTCALHLALASLGIGTGDEVIIPDLTIISDALAAIYVGASPVFVDVDKKTANIDVDKIEKKITKKTKAIIAVHLLGRPVNLNALCTIAKKNKLFLIEDAAEALGVTYRTRAVGSYGDVSIFSFYSNKLITTGEGGMLVTNNKKIYKRAQLLKNLSHSPHKRFHHSSIGFNYKMTNIQASVGLAHLKKTKVYINKKKSISRLYTQLLAKIPFIELPDYSDGLCWMYNILVAKKAPFTRNMMAQFLRFRGIETRDYFFPLHKQPALKPYINPSEHYPVSNDFSKRGLYLPSGLTLTNKKIRTVARAIDEFVNAYA